ncbi:hypothetical protein WISP_49098 [Willisornis vidua]|uniref:Reverse transcriptase domain-containing protein n=1 Tax=Willisornis vidua TaxID=1566151 RepID=A0ABQ9DH65_9PASS|nr:hypothetical protein WISP_49098 [Willisornis vidua]
MEHLIQEAISIHLEDKKVMRSSHHGFTTVNSSLTNLIAFSDENASWMDKGRAVGIVYLSITKAFNTVSHNVLKGKLRKCGLDECTVRWIDNCLNG